jgi:hypothetical protein
MATIHLHQTTAATPERTDVDAVVVRDYPPKQAQS